VLALAVTAIAAFSAATLGPATLARADGVRDTEMWVLNELNMQSAWTVTQGKGVVVAVIDSGVDPDVTDLAGNVESGPNFSGVHTPPSNQNWGVHGTWMASLIAGHGNGPGGGSGIIGTAPESKVLPIRVITDNHDPNNAAYQDSLGWAYFKQNKLDEAEGLLRQAVAKEGHDPTILSHLGDVYAKLGKDSLAEAHWQRSLDEWHRALPADFESAKMAEVEQKITALKRRLAQQKPPSEPKP